MYNFNLERKNQIISVRFEESVAISPIKEVAKIEKGNGNVYDLIKNTLKSSIGEIIKARSEAHRKHSGLFD